MKKRRPCTWNHTRLTRNSSRFLHVGTLEAFPEKTKSFHDLKRRRLQHDNSKENTEKRSNDYHVKKRDAFRSLESLFDVKKSLVSPEIHLLTIEYHREGYIICSPKKETSKNFIDLISPQSQGVDLQSQILEQNHESSYYHYEEELKDVTEIKTTQDIETLEIHEIHENKERLTINMADDEDQQKEQEEREEEGVGVEVIPEETVTDESLPEINEENGTKGEPLPPHTIPPGIEEGVLIKPDEHRESELSPSPLTDTAVMKEMKAADERCIIVAKEIEQLKREISELTNKEELTQEDTVEIQEKQDSIMSKLAEFEEITRKLQRLLGLSDPSSYTFAKMFGMLPYPHKKTDDDELLKVMEKEIILEEEEEVEDEEEEEEEEDEKKVEEEKKKAKPKEIKDIDRFELPQKPYPEDQLPKVIICGHTEDNIPKIVVADNDQIGKKRCLQNLTGKLTESLSMQEKLVKENAQLEGGKYKLEEALLEKDTAVESLQRKVCGLQAEMRIVVKENTELSRQLANLNQRMTTPTCCYTCPGGAPSSPTASLPLASRSYASSLPEDDYCPCKCCLQPQLTNILSPTDNIICDSSRLTGGASRTRHCQMNESSSETGDMCCRSPAAAKRPCAGPPQRGTCPAELENKLAIYGNSTKQLEQQLGSMENEVRSMQAELANVQRERQQLEQQRKLLKCTGPCAPCACSPPPLQPTGVPSFVSQPAAPIPPVPPTSMSSSVSPVSLPKMTSQSAPPMCTGTCVSAPMGTSTCPQQQLRDLREQYARLQDDYKNKLCEVSYLRTDTEKLKQEARDAKEEKEKLDIKLTDVQERMKLFEAEKDKFQGYREQMVEQEQALIVAKQRFREAQDELEELRTLIQDQAAQLEDYRNKYLQAQQQVEEQRRQLDLMEMDNARMNENVTLEIGRVKNQFQEKLAELAPLPDILKQTQMKLQEAQQMRLVAERNCEDLSRELIGCKDKIQTLQNQLDGLRNEYQALQDERGHGTGRFEEMERKYNELRHENERMKNTLARFEEHEAQLQKRIDEKMHEITQLNAMLEQVREDSARQVARTKERCETVRRSMQGQIAEMERQLAQCRATARAAQKDRDEIRQKMQGQINNLNEAFQQAQGRIRSLQGHVNYLKTSYSNIFKDTGETPISILPGGTPGTGYDTCDCNY